jgi:DNA primase
MHIDIESILNELEIDYKSHKKYYKALCPFHNEDTASWAIEKNEPYRYHCFGCNTKGTIFTLYKQKTGIDLYKRLGLNEKDIEFYNNLRKRKKQVIKTYDIKDRISLSSGKLLDVHGSKEVLDYLYNRGCTDEFIKTYNIRYSKNVEYISTEDSSEFTRFFNRIIIELYYQGKLQNIEGRDYTKTSKSKVLYAGGGSVDFLFNYDYLNKEDDLYVVEGIFDLVALYALGLRNITCTFGTGISENQKNQLNEFKRVFMFPDNDEAGDKSIIEYNSFMKKDFYICRSPSHRKDPGECTKEEVQWSIDNKISNVEYFNKRNKSNIIW